MLSSCWKRISSFTFMKVKLFGLFPLQEFLREARIMSGLDHPCIVRLIGVCLGPPLILVSESVINLFRLSRN